MTVRKKNLSKTGIFANILLLYPVINLILSCLFHGDNMIVTSLLFDGLIFIEYFLLPGGRIRIHRSWIPIILVLMITMIISGMRESKSTFGISLSYAATVLIFLIDSDDFYITNLEKEIISKRKLSYFAQTIFFVILIAYTANNGLYARWSTYVLKGPYPFPHTLAYILFFLFALDLFLYMQEKEPIALITGLINLIILLLTGVRTAFIAACFTILFFLTLLFKRKQYWRLYFVIALALIIGFVVYFRGYATPIIQKTVQAIHHGSITNGRLDIAENSLQALNLKEQPWNLIMGIGLDGLSNSNFLLMHSAIHAHNDLINVLVCYGLISFFIYCFAFYKYAGKRIFWTIATVGVLALGNGLFIYFDCISLLIYTKLLFRQGSNQQLCE